MARGGSLIGALRVTLGLDSANFEAGTKRAKSIAARDATAIQKSLSGIKNSLNGLITAATITSLVAAGKRALDYASSLGEVSQQLGVTTDDLQVYRFVASQVGIEQDAMDASLAKLTKSMGEADNGSKKQASAFRELGVAVKDANGNLLTAGDVMPRLADAFSRIKDPITRARLETELFGKSGQKLDTLLAGGSAAIRDMEAEARRLGLVLGENLIKKADDAADRLGVLTKVLEVQVAKAVAENADGILAMADAFISLVGAIGSAMSWLQRFGVQARQTLNAAKGWDVFGRPVDSDSARRARMRYFGESVDQQAREEEIGKLGKTILPKAVPQGALPTASGGGKRTPKPPKDRAEEIDERFNRELAGLQDDQLQLQQGLTTSLEERTQIEMRRIRTAQDAYEHEVDSRKKQGDFGNDKALAEARAAQLKAAYADKAAMEQNVAWNRSNAEAERETFDLVNEGLDLRRDRLDLENDEARTAAERRRIGMAMLDIDIERQRAAVAHLQKMFELNQATDAEVRAAENRLTDMEGLRGAREAQVRRGTMGPLESYLDEIPKTADEINEAFERASVEGLADFRQGLGDALLNGAKLGDVLENAMKRFQAKLLDLAIDKGFQALLGGGNGGSGGGLINSFASMLGLARGGGGSAVSAFGAGASGVGAGASAFSIPGLAKGGSFMPGGIPGIDKNVLSINGIPKVRVSANENIRVSPLNDNPTVVQLVVGEGQMFEPRVAGISGRVSVETTRTGIKATQRKNRQAL